MAGKRERQERERLRRERRKRETRRAFLVTFAAVLMIGAVSLTAGLAVLDESVGIGIRRVFGAGNSPQENGTGAEEGQIPAEDMAQAGDGILPGEETSALPAENGEAGQEAAEEEKTGKYSELLADPERMAAERIYAKETASQEAVTMAFAGDILFDDGYAIMAKMRARGQGIEGSISAELLEQMRAADILVVNNEFPYTERGTATAGKAFTFRARPEHAQLLWDMGADLVSLANNHAYDYGEVSLLDSMETLQGIGMPYVGAGHNLEEAAQPVTFLANDLRIAVIAATQIERLDQPDTRGATAESPGVFRCWNPEKLLETVARAKEENDFVIVYIHWGTESVTEIDWAQKEQAAQIAEAGADLIVGNHPHILQKIGYCGEVPVIYSLGNFLFNSKTQDSCLIRATIDENGLQSLQFLPALQKDCTVSLQTGAEKERVLQFMREISPEVSIDAEGFVTKNESGGKSEGDA